MSSMVNVLKALGPIDARNIGRDSLQRWMSIMPFFFAFLFRFLVPWVREQLLVQFEFDLAPYYILLMSYGFMIGTPVLFGVVIGFLLLDERDDGTLTALQVTPMCFDDYLIYRTTMPMVLSVVLTILAFPLAKLATLPFGALLMVAIASAPMAPLFALYLAILAKNKVQGFAVMKASGILFVAPIFSYFIQSDWQLAFGILPTYWPIKLYWVLDSGESGAWLYFTIALIYAFLLLAGTLRIFNRMLRQ